jgi:hypothetical protein
MNVNGKYFFNLISTSSWKNYKKTECYRKKFHNRWKAQAEALAIEIGELEEDRELSKYCL